MSRHHDSHLWASLLGRLRQSDMAEEDLRECSPAIQRQILFDLGYDANAVAALQDLLRERAASSSISPGRSYFHSGGRGIGGGSDPVASLLSVYNERKPGSVEWGEVEQAVGGEAITTELGASIAVEVRGVSTVPQSTVPAAEKGFRAARIESGCQPERLFRFVPKKHADAVATSCNIFDSFLEGFDFAFSKHGQAIGRTLVACFSPKDLERYSEVSIAVGVDALVMRPILMTAPQFHEWCANISDSAEAHRALAEHGATCVQITGDDDEKESKGDVNSSGGVIDSYSKIVVFDSRIVILRMLANIATVRDAFHCAPGAIAARGCSRHGNRKFEFWCTAQRRLMCSLCLYYEPEARNDCIVIDEAYSTEMTHCSSFREAVKGRQLQVARTLSHLDTMQDSLPDRTAMLRESIENAFAEIRRLVDLQEADLYSTFDMAVRNNAESLTANADLMRRYEADSEAYMTDASNALSLRDPTRILGVAQLAYATDDGTALELGAPEEHSRLFDLPDLKFDRGAVLEALQKSVRLAGGTLRGEEELRDEALRKQQQQQDGEDDGL